MVKFAVGENRVYGDVGRRYLLIEKFVNCLHRKLVPRSIEHEVIGFTERRRMRRDYLGDPHNLVDKVAVASLVVPRGFHLIEVLEKKGDMFNARHILLKPEYTEEDQTKAFKTLDSLRTEIQNGNISFEMAARFYSQDPATRTNGGLSMRS